MRMPPLAPKLPRMTRLLSSLAQIALLRKDPGVLPASFLLVALLAVAYASASALHAFVSNEDRIVARAAIDLGLTLAFFWALLALTRRSHRYAQTISAVLGVYVLIAPLIAVFLLLRKPAESIYFVWLVTTTGSVLVVIWYLLIVAHIVKCALDTGLVTGYAIAVTWLLATLALTARLVPPAAA
jgi:hypothetical protein